MLYYLLFWTLWGFIIHFYIIFGTNLLTEGLMPVFVFFLPILEFYRKGIPNGVQTEWNLRDDISWTRSKPGDLEMKSETQRGDHKGGGNAQGVGHAPTLWAPQSSPDLVPSPIYTLIPQKHQGSHENTFPLPQPSVPVRSHLGAFSGVLPERDSITEGFYINTITLVMKRE